MLRRSHDVLVVDTPTVMDDTTLAILDDADVVIAVNDAHRASLLKTERCYAVLTAAEFPMGKLIRVANHARGASGFDTGAVPHAQPEAVLPFDPQLAADELAGRAIASAHPDAQFARGISGLARLVATRLMGQESQAAVRAA
jgi:Flp pilus assembly CpaE family ATPase